MSEFACRHGHLMSALDRQCQECAAEGRFEQCYTMDGMTSSQLSRREWDENRREYESEDEDYVE